ncbi:MAG: hypothetical protein WDN00_18090 [Limisphaerales bacterium]
MKKMKIGTGVHNKSWKRKFVYLFERLGGWMYRARIEQETAMSVTVLCNTTGLFDGNIHYSDPRIAVAEETAEQLLLDKLTEFFPSKQVTVLVKYRLKKETPRMLVAVK